MKLQNISKHRPCPACQQQATILMHPIHKKEYCVDDQANPLYSCENCPRIFSIDEQGKMKEWQNPYA